MHLGRLLGITRIVKPRRAKVASAAALAVSLAACGGSAHVSVRDAGPSSTASADTTPAFLRSVEAICLSTQVQSPGAPANSQKSARAEKTTSHALSILRRRVRGLRALRPPFAVAGTYPRFVQDNEVLAKADALILRQIRAIRAGGRVPASQFRSTEKQLPNALTNLHEFTQTNNLPACGGG